MESALDATVPAVLKHEQRLSEKHLLSLAVRNTVLAVLAPVTSVPFEALDAVEVKHLCMLS